MPPTPNPAPSMGRALAAKDFTMATIIISKSTRPRSGTRYRKEHGNRVVERDGFTRQWKQIVEKTDAGYKKKNGKPAKQSTTYHVPA